MKAGHKNKRDSAGDCVSHPEHGAAFVLTSGALWCPHQSHDTEKGGTPWVEHQKAPGSESETPTTEAEAVVVEA